MQTTSLQRPAHLPERLRHVPGHPALLVRDERVQHAHLRARHNRWCPRVHQPGASTTHTVCTAVDSPPLRAQAAPTSFAQATGGTQTCTQSTDARCTSAFLQATFSPFSAVVAAYCTDQFLVVVHYNSPTTFSETLGGHNLDMMNSVVYPPQGGTGNICVTRQGSFTCSTTSISKIPLNFTLLPTDSSLNNANTNVFGAGTSAGGNSGGWILLNSLANSPGTVTPTALNQVGLPDRGATGVALNGQQIYPQYNNVGYRDVEQCNLNACGEHSGGGGGLPHFHLDGFHSQNICFYGPANYSSTTAHPPLIGLAFDGGWIYGRHLYSGSEGATVALDNCGGHTHPSAVLTVNGVYHCTCIPPRSPGTLRRALTSPRRALSLRRSQPGTGRHRHRWQPRGWVGRCGHELHVQHNGPLQLLARQRVRHPQLYGTSGQPHQGVRQQPEILLQCECRS